MHIDCGALPLLIDSPLTLSCSAEHSIAIFPFNSLFASTLCRADIFSYESLAPCWQEVWAAQLWSGQHRYYMVD